MSLFISKENQNLLYEMINKTPEINKVFSSVDEKNRWFRRSIESQYEQLPQVITREVLLMTNRKVLSSMVEQLRVAYANKMVNNPPINSLKRDNAPNIEQIQSQYNSMFDPPKPKKIDFSEKLDDDVITNMEELIENQKKMRERELQEYSPPPPTPPTLSTKINILEDISKDVLKPITERRVQFDISEKITESQNPPISFTEEITKRMDRLEDKMDQLISLFRTSQTPQINNQPEHNITILKQLINEDA